MLVWRMPHFPPYFRVRFPLSEVPAETTRVVPVLVGVPSDRLPPGHYEAQLTFTYLRNSETFTLDPPYLRQASPSPSSEVL